MSRPVSGSVIASEPTVPRLLSKSGSFSLVSSPLRSSFAVPPRRPSRVDTSCQGFFPLRGVTAGVHSLLEHARSRYVPSSGFLNLSTASSTCRLCGLVASRSHVQGFTVQGLLPFRSRPDSSPVRASMPLSSRCSPAQAPAATTRRLGYEALLRGVMRSSRSVFSLPLGRSPLRFLPPPGSGLPTAAPVPRVVRS